MAVEQPAQLAALEALQQEGVATPTGLLLTTEISFSAWCALLDWLGKYRDWTAFAIGDALIYGEARFGDDYAQGVDLTNRSEETLTRYYRVAMRVPLGRRNPGLSWSHHAEIAALSPAEQIRWLDKAATETWSSGRLRRELREAQAIEQGSQPRWLPKSETEYQEAERDALEHGYGVLVKGKRVPPQDVTVVRPTDAPIPPPTPPPPKGETVVCPNCGTILQ